MSSTRVLQASQSRGPTGEPSRRALPLERKVGGTQTAGKQSMEPLRRSVPLASVAGGRKLTVDRTIFEMRMGL